MDYNGFRSVLSEMRTSLGNSGHLPPELTDGAKDLLGSLSGWLLYPINISGQKAFINANGAGDFRDIQLRKSLENIGNGIICIRFSSLKETADMDILIDFIPADIVSINPYFILGSLLRGSFEEDGERFKRTAVFISMIGQNEDSFITEP